MVLADAVAEQCVDRFGRTDCIGSPEHCSHDFRVSAFEEQENFAQHGDKSDAVAGKFVGMQLVSEVGYDSIRISLIF